MESSWWLQCPFLSSPSLFQFNLTTKISESPFSLILTVIYSHGSVDQFLCSQLEKSVTIFSSSSYYISDSSTSLFLQRKILKPNWIKLNEYTWQIFCLFYKRDNCDFPFAFSNAKSFGKGSTLKGNNLLSITDKVDEIIFAWVTSLWRVGYGSWPCTWITKMRKYF